MSLLTRPATPLAAPRSASAGRGKVVPLALIVLGCMAIYALFIPRIMAALDPLTGDEPFYVMTALSIAHDGDLDETNNYARRDYRSFYPPDPLPAGWQGWPAFPRELPPHAAHSVRPGLYSKHGLGVAVLILAPYLLGGRLATILFLNLVAALVAANIALLARRYGHGWLGAVALGLPLVLANPLMSYAYLIFPEIFAALAIIYAYRRSREAQNTALQWLGVGLALAVLPWLHARFIPAVLGLVAILLAGWLREPSWRRRLAGLLPPLCSAVALLGYYLAIYGKPFPSTEDHAGFNTPPEIVNAAFGLFLDEQWGLLIHAPIYLLTAVGLGVLWRMRRGDLLAILAVALPYLALVAFYRVWWGEWGPAARYLTPLAPLAIAPLAAWAAQVRRAVAVVTVGLLALPGLAIMAGFLAAPQLMYNQPDGFNALFSSWAASRGQVWPKFFPSFQPYALSPIRVRELWSAWLAVLAALLGGLGLLLPPKVEPREENARATPDQGAVRV
jgi:hypothetical protein